WDDPKTVQALHTAVATLAKGQEQLRQTTSQAARDMPPQSGNLRIGVGMLADTEMIRAIRILESLPARDGADAKRAALADARLTQEPPARSFKEIGEKYISSRNGGERPHMVPFVEMPAERQGRPRDEPRRHAPPPPAELLKGSMQRRQLKILEL